MPRQIPLESQPASARGRARPPPEPFDARDPAALDLRGFGAVIITSGFRPDYRRWVNLAGGFDQLGFPVHRDCQSTVAPGLFFAGVHFLRKRKSSLLFGVGEDATIVAQGVAEHLESGSPRRLSQFGRAVPTALLEDRPRNFSSIHQAVGCIT